MRRVAIDPLRVAAVTREADAVLSLTLRHPDGLDLPPREPGAHIDLHLSSGRIRPSCTNATQPKLILSAWPVMPADDGPPARMRDTSGPSGGLKYPASFGKRVRASRQRTQPAQ